MSSATPLLSRFGRVQTLADLRALARSMSASSRARLTGRLPDVPVPEALDEAIAGSGRLNGHLAELHPALALAATLPGEDAAGFAGATALLLLDRLQDGTGEDDLYWHFDAHESRYRLLPDPARAALMQGYRRLHAEGHVALDAMPEMGSAVREVRHTVLKRLDAAEPQDSALGLAALRSLRTGLSGDVASSAALWADRARDVAALQGALSAALIGGFRHLYETRPDWDPYADWNEAGLDSEAVAIPFSTD